MGTVSSSTKVWWREGYSRRTEVISFGDPHHRGWESPLLAGSDWSMWTSPGRSLQGHPGHFVRRLEVQFSSVQSLSHVHLFATPQTAARQASLSITNSRSLLKLMSIELVMPSNHLILCPLLLLPPLIFPSIRVFTKSQFFTSGGQSTGVSASASVLPMNIQD